jgi:hypothetical protein
MIHQQGRSRLLASERRNGVALGMDFDAAGQTMIVTDPDVLIELGLMLFRQGRKMKRLAK